MAITIVSGLPRSGTSLMMQMLKAGGFPILSDNERKADTDNPRGYLEWERVRELAANPSLIVWAEGKAVKVISPLIRSLPPGLAYRVIFMHRPIREVLKSQDVMLRRIGISSSPADLPALTEAFERHLARVNEWLGGQGNAQVFHIDYHRVLREPMRVAADIAFFLNAPLDTGAMAGQVNRSLCRNRMAEVA